VRAALDSRSTATNDFFGGWDETDVEFLAQWAADPAMLAPVPGVIVDWLGGRTKQSNHGWLPVPPDGCIVVADLPVPDDQIHAETIEYVALLRSVDRARRRGDGFTMFELGSSYAPWCVLAGLTARRAGLSPIKLCAVEASRATIDRIHEHIRLNHLDDGGDVSWEVVHAAVSDRSGKVYFPRVDTRADNGAQVTRSRGRTDYRGVKVDYDEVRAVTFAELSASYRRVDFVHLDLQGAEQALLEDDAFLKRLTACTSAVLLATQSRLVEGIALRSLAARGWRLVRERPTTFAQNERTADVNGWTTRDGAQFWINTRFD
jgi:FkbM family methyltransferase